MAYRTNPYFCNILDIPMNLIWIDNERVKFAGIIFLNKLKEIDEKG